MSVQKLRLYAMIMRLRELEQERIERRLKLFKRPPLTITLTKLMLSNPMNSLYDEKGVLLDPPKSKYIDKPLRNYKR